MHFRKIAVLAVGLLLTGCASSSHQTAQQQLGQQSVLAVNWFQQSGEYQALTH